MRYIRGIDSQQVMLTTCSLEDEISQDNPVRFIEIFVESLKGVEKVTAEFALSSLSYDIRRAIRICGGVKELIDRYKGIIMPETPEMARV